jgi:uncharacterized membrane protein
MLTRATEKRGGGHMRLFSIRPGLTLSGRKFKGIGGWAGKPSHPPLTDFPIVCWLVAAIFDVISVASSEGSDRARDFFVAATFVAVIGVFGALGAIITGFWDWWKGVERERTGPIGRAKHTQVWRTVNWHAAVMLTAGTCSVVNVLTRVSDFQVGQTPTLNLVFGIAAAALVTLGAVYGGSLVYDYQFNVESLKGSTAWDETEADQLPGDRSHPPAEPA